MRVPLRQRSAAAADTPLGAFSAAVELEPEQQNAIHLVIEMANEGAAAVSIVNPLDFLGAGILVWNAKGEPAARTSVAPRLLINTAKPELRLPFRLESVEIGGAVLPPDAVQAATMLLVAHHRMRIKIAITVDEPGDYQLETIVTLVMHDDNRSASFESPLLAVRVTG